MQLLLTVPCGDIRDKYFPPKIQDKMRTLGTLRVNEMDRNYTKEELATILGDVDVVFTHWGSVQFNEDLLNCAPNLKLLAHCAGTVAHIASDAFFARDIPVLSANPIMAHYVAEWVLGAIISGLHTFSQYDAAMRRGVWHKCADRSLFDVRLGLVGLGMVGRNLLNLLRPFGCTVTVYDPFVASDVLDAWEFAHLGSFEEAMRCDVVSIHAAQTPETFHMINAEAMRLIPDGGLLINSARGSLVDTEALIRELESGRIYAVLDVYEKEGCAQDSRLLACRDNSLLMPHTAALPAGVRMTATILEDVERYMRGEPLWCRVSREQYLRMTQE